MTSFKAEGASALDASKHRYLHLHQQVHHISRHLLYQDVDDSQYLGLCSGQGGGVDVLL